MFAWLSQPDNRALLSWLGGGLAVIAAGAWTVATYVWPHGGGDPSIVCGQGGSASAGHDSTGNIITVNGTVTNAAPCVPSRKP